MIELLPEAGWMGLFGLLGGIALGLAARLGRFCTLGAIEDYLYAGSAVRLRTWGLAIGIAIVGTFAAAGLGLVDLANTVYLGAWNPFAAVIGGLIFGYGMAISGNCGYGALARLGGGDLRSFVIVLVMGVAAYATASGLLAELRVLLFPPFLESGGGIAGQLAAATNLPLHAIGIAVGLMVIAVPLWTRPDGERLPAGALIAGTVVGLAIVSGWIGTSWVTHAGFDAPRVVSHTFSAPVGETMLYIMTSSGRTLTFGVGSVTGVIVGAFIGSLMKGHFRWEACEDPRELTRQIGGAALMGIGAVTAVGCSVGQGLSAFSVLAFSAPITLAAIVAGAALGLRQLITGFSRI